MNKVSSFLPAKVLIALVFCLASILPAQVHIREKVAITPKASVQTSSTSAASVQLTTELSLSGSTQPTRPPFISVRNITCGTENASNGAPVTVTALAGGYNITAGFGAQGIVDWRFTVRFGSETLTDDSGQAQPNTTLRFVQGYSLFNAVLFSNLWPGSTLRPGSGVEFTLFGENAPACGNAVLTENTPLTLTITEGAAYGSLWKNGVSSGSSLTLLLSELPFLQFIADGDVPEEAEANVVIEAIAGGASLGTLKLVVAREIDHFEITSEDDTLQYGGSTKLTVIAKDENNQEFPYGGSKEVRFSLSPGGGIIVAATAMAGSPEAGAAAPSVVAEVQAPELGSFIVSQTDTVADEVGVAYSKARAGEVSFLANGAPTGDAEPQTISINVEAIESPEKTGSTDVMVEKGGSNHFRVITEKDTVAFTELTRIFVQAKNAADQDIELESETLLRFTVTANQEYGTFIGKNSDTVKTDPPILENVTYADAQGGLIRFAAVKKNPDSVVLCTLLVEHQNNPATKGDTSLVVTEQTLKIVMTQPYEVRPVIPPIQVNAPRAENRKQLSVRLTRAGTPVSNHPFRLTTRYVDGSGGHDHTIHRRDENRENYGHFILLRTGIHHDRPYDGQTQTDGVERLDYVASIFGDSMIVRVDSRQNRLLIDSVIVVESTPNLQLLSDGANYIKVGGTDRHHGPPGYEEDNNHYGTGELLGHVELVANGFAAVFRGYRLMVNDISLPFGGAFDIFGNWDQDVSEANCGHQGHCGHRRGLNADISFQVVGPAGQQVLTTQRQRRRLLEIIQDIAGDPVRHSNHYHIQ